MTHDQQFVLKAEAAVAMAKGGRIAPQQLLAYLSRLCGQYQAHLNDLAFMDGDESLADVKERNARLSGPGLDWDLETEQKWQAPDDNDAPLSLGDF